MEMTKLLREQARNLRVLYVEDEEQLRTSVLELLSNFFLDIDLAVDGRDGLQKYLEYKKENDKPYDLIITDINMPNMNGVDFLREVFNEVPKQLAVVISAHSDADNLLKLINIKVKYFIIKPIVHKKIIEVLFDVCKEINDNVLLEKYYEGMEDFSGELSNKISELEKLTSSQKKTIAKLEAEIAKLKANKTTQNKTTPSQKVEVSTVRQRNLQCTAEEKIDAHAFVAGLDEYFIDKMDVFIEQVDQLGLAIHALEGMSLEKSIIQMKQIQTVFFDFTHLVDSLVSFPKIVKAFSTLNEFLENIDMQYIYDNKQQSILVTKLLGINKDIERWVNNVFVKMTVDDIHYFDVSFANNCLDVKTVLDRVEIEDDDEVDFII